MSGKVKKSKSRRKRLTSIPKSKARENRLRRQKNNSIVNSIEYRISYSSRQLIEEESNILDLLPLSKLVSYSLYKFAELGNLKSFMESFIKPFRGYKSASILFKQAELVSSRYGSYYTTDEKGNDITFRDLFWNRVQEEKGDPRSLFQRGCECLLRNRHRMHYGIDRFHYYDFRGNIALSHSERTEKFSFSAFLDRRDPSKVFKRILGRKIEKGVVNRVMNVLNITELPSYIHFFFVSDDSTESIYRQIVNYYLNWILKNCHWSIFLDPESDSLYPMFGMAWLWPTLVENDVPEGLIVEAASDVFIINPNNTNEISVKYGMNYGIFRKFYLGVQVYLTPILSNSKDLARMVVQYVDPTFFFLN